MEEERILQLEKQFKDQKFLLDELSYRFNKKDTIGGLDRRLTQLIYPLDDDGATDGVFSSSNNSPVVSLSDASTRTMFMHVVPFIGFEISRMYFIWSTSATSGNLRWQIDIGEGGEGDANNARTTGGSAILTATTSTANDLNYTNMHNATGVNLVTLRRNNKWGIKFTRTGAHADDTLSASIIFHGIVIEYLLKGSI